MIIIKFSLILVFLIICQFFDVSVLIYTHNDNLEMFLFAYILLLSIILSYKNVLWQLLLVHISFVYSCLFNLIYKGYVYLYFFTIYNKEFLLEIISKISNIINNSIIEKRFNKDFTFDVTSLDYKNLIYECLDKRILNDKSIKNFIDSYIDEISYPSNINQFNIFNYVSGSTICFFTISLCLISVICYYGYTNNSIDIDKFSKNVNERFTLQSESSTKLADSIDILNKDIISLTDIVNVAHRLSSTSLPTEIAVISASLEELVETVMDFQQKNNNNFNCLEEKIEDLAPKKEKKIQFFTNGK